MKKFSVIQGLAKSEPSPSAPAGIETDSGTSIDWSTHGALQSLMVRLGEQSEAERRAFLADCAEIEALRPIGSFAAVPPVVPSIGGRRISLSPALLCGLFAVGPHARWDQCEDDMEYHNVAASFSTSLQYRGPRPDQDAATVLLALIRQQIGQPIGREIVLSLRSFGRALGWSDTSNTTNRCVRALRALAAGRARYPWNGECTVEIGFIRIHEISGTRAIVSFDPSFGWAFTGYQTYLDFERRTLLRVGLETWLYGIAMSTTCRNAFAVHNLHHLSGSTKMLRDFGTDLVEAMAQLVRCGLVEDSEIDGQPIRLARPQLFSTDTDDVRPASTPARRTDPITYLRIIKRTRDMLGDVEPGSKSPQKPKRRKTAPKEPAQISLDVDSYESPVSWDEDDEPTIDDMGYPDDE